MKCKVIAILCILALILSLTACGGGEESTLTGMVMSVDGTTLSIVEMDASSMADRGNRGENGERPSMPEGVERPEGMEIPTGEDGSFDFGNFGGFNGEGFSGEGFDGEGFMEGGFNGMFPGGEGFDPENMPQWGEGERPSMPEGMERPEGMEPPEGMEIPTGEDGSFDFGNFGGFGGGGFSGDGSNGGFGSMMENAETKTVDIANAHISIEIEGGKEGGSLSDITAGTFVTITLNSKGEATYVLISQRSPFRGRQNG